MADPRIAKDVDDNLVIKNGGVVPENDNSEDIGRSTKQWKDIYLKGSLKNASDSRSVAQIVTDAAKLATIDENADVTGDNAPKAHAASHKSAGGDPVKLDELKAPDDNTNLDVSITKHGLVPKGTNVGDFLKDDGSWDTPAGGGGGVGTSGVPVATDYAKFTDADTIEGREKYEVI